MKDLFANTYVGALLAGVDEVGRGPLAGDVVAAAVILNPKKRIKGLADSKKLSESQREMLYGEICAKATSWAVARATVEEIDSINILQATLLAMRRAVEQLHIQPEHVMVDGNQLPRWSYSCEAIIQGDDKVKAISAASIIAKVTRDREMIQFDAHYPGYGFASHKGYGTREHLTALQKFGATPLHRRSFAPVRAVMERGVSIEGTVINSMTMTLASAELCEE